MRQAHVGMEFNDVLVESIEETITSLLSRAVLDALYVHIETNHSISRDEVTYRFDTLFTTLEKIFGGPSSQTISRAVARKFYLKLGLEFTTNPTHSLIEYVDDAKLKLQNSSSQVTGKTY